MCADATAVDKKKKNQTKPKKKMKLTVRYGRDEVAVTVRASFQLETGAQFSLNKRT